jgi:hypothetical protein
MDELGYRRETHSNAQQAHDSTSFQSGEFIRVTDNLSKGCIFYLRTLEDSEDWIMVDQRNTQWADKQIEFKVFSAACEPQTKDHINPAHYKGYVDNMQWLEVMVKLPRFKNPEVFKGALELQIRKYLDRNGKKDAELQELQKALFYMKYLVAYIKAGEVPISIEDVETILKGQ